MRIAIDSTPLATGHKKRGIGVYTKQLLENLKLINSGNEYIFFTRGQRLPKVDLVHYPYFDLFFLTLPLKKPFKTVITVHDLIPLVFPKFYPKGLRGLVKFHLQKFSAKNVDGVICDSENSKKDIIKFLKVPENKIFKVFLAADNLFRLIKDKKLLTKTQKKYNLPQEFILYVGDVNLQKNLRRLLNALTNINLPLVMVGEALADENLTETKNLLTEIEKLKLEKKVLRLGFVETQDLANIYNLATLFVEPSLYEGFGLPLLEAMACGVPVVSSNSSSLPEIGGEAPVYFNPNSEKEMADCIKKVIYFKEKNYAEYDELKNKGLSQAAKFSWEKTAKETLKVYQKIVNG